MLQLLTVTLAAWPVGVIVAVLLSRTVLGLRLRAVGLNHGLSCTLPLTQVELAETLSTDDSPRFVNGLLARLLDLNPPLQR